MDVRSRFGLPAGAARSSSFLLVIATSRYWDESRSQNCLAVTPATRTTLSRLRSPEAILTEERRTFKDLAKNSTHASLAAPFTGGAVMASLSAPPTSPVIEFVFARGCTLTGKVMLPECSVTDTMGLPPRLGIVRPARHLTSFFSHVRHAARV